MELPPGGDFELPYRSLHLNTSATLRFWVKVWDAKPRPEGFSTDLFAPSYGFDWMPKRRRNPLSWRASLHEHFLADWVDDFRSLRLSVLSAPGKFLKEPHNTVTTVHVNAQNERDRVEPATALGTPLGASWQDGNCDFTVWAPRADRVEVRLLNGNRRFELEPNQQGYYRAPVANVDADERYFFRLNEGKERADPASRFQPEGVFGPSNIVAPSGFVWQDQDWPGLALKDYILYEVHVGTYSPSGTFDELAESIPVLKSLGVTAIELMPIAQFPGSRNWGYDGVFPFAVQNSYGGPRGLQRFVNACHREGLAVVLDVVYNHLGPEGNFLADFGPYFTDRYQTPWGQAINFDGAHSDNVVRFFIENALYWLEAFHIDALRLDAIHGIFDRNARPFLSLLSAAVAHFAQRSLRRVYLIAESDLNDPIFVRARNAGGIGLDAQWNDDFHHSLHALQTCEKTGYYIDFGSLDHLRTALQDGYVYSGQYSSYRQHRHGASSSEIRPSQLVVFSQNHDQVGNRGRGERTSTLISFEAQKLSAGIVLLSPNIPLLFMGEEYGETAPFLYFTDHSDPALGDAVRKGRQAEFSGFHANGDLPDPQGDSTFLKSKLNHSLTTQGKHKVLRSLYEELLRLRKTHRSFGDLDTANIDASICGRCLAIRRSYADSQLLVIANFGDDVARYRAALPPGKWRKLLDSADTKWMGPGSSVPGEVLAAPASQLPIQPKSFCIFESGHPVYSSSASLESPS
jgi:maltooligosyltrehalose trehalohydrolase